MGERRIILVLGLLTLAPLARAQTADAPPATPTPPTANPPSPNPPSSPPGKSEEAKSLFEKGMTLYALGRYADAAPLFERAFEIKPVPALLYNAAQAHRLAGHAARAVTLYESYLQLYGDPTRKPEIEAHIAELKQAIAAQEHAATSPPTGAEPPPPSTTAPSSTPAPSEAPSSETLTASAPPKKTPLVKRPWFWAAVAGGAVVIAGVAVGIAFGTRGHTSPPATFGTVNGN